MYRNLKNIAETELQNNVIDEYVESNNKMLIPELLDIIESDEKLFEANETAKASCTLLYRGLALDESIPDMEIIAYDMQQDYVATSRSEQIAKDYAKGKDQIDGKDEVKPKYSVVLVYDVSANTNAVAFDSSIFNKEHARLETVIDASMAKLVRIDNILVDEEQ